MKNLIPIAFLVLLTSCAGFQSGELEEVSELPEVERPKKVHLSMDFTREMNGDPAPLLNSMKKSSYLGVAEDVFDDQKNVTVVEDQTSADVAIHIDFTENERGSIGMAVLTGLTLWLVPNEVSMRYTADVTVTRPAGRGFHLADHTTTYHQLFLLPIMPFKLPAIQRTSSIEKIFRHTFKRLHQQNVVHGGGPSYRNDEYGITNSESL